MSTVMFRTPILSCVLLMGVALASTSCLLPPLWLTVDDSDAGADSKSMTGSRDVGMRVPPVAVDDTVLDASMPKMVGSDAAAAAPPIPPSMLEPTSANTNVSDAGAIAGSCTADAQCTAGQVCATRAPDLSGVCVDPHVPCLTIGDAAICDPQGVMYECQLDGTIGGQLKCDSPEMCRTGLPIRRCRVCEPASYKCSESLLLLCSTDGASWKIVMQCASAVLCDGAFGKCEAPTCQPGTGTCNGATLTKCNDDGTGVTTQICSASQTCDAPGAKCM